MTTFAPRIRSDGSGATTLSGMTTFAPRIRKELLQAVVRHDDRSHPIAETCRRVGRDAERLGLTRPSYQRLRELVHESRRLRQNRGPSPTSVLVDVAFRLRPPIAVLDHLSGTGVPELPR